MQTPSARTSAEDAAIAATPAAAVPEDVRAFVRDHHLARPSVRHTLVRLGALAAAWAGLVAAGFAVDSLALWMPIWLALALLTACPVAMMHEAVHHNLFGARATNHVVGTVAAAWLFFHGPAYRAWHLTHHAYTFEPGDSEQLPSRFRSRMHYVAYCLALGPLFAFVLWFGALATVAGRPPKWIGTSRLQRHVRRWAVAPALVLAGAAALGVWQPALVVKGWLVPALLGSLVVFPLLTMPEHLGGKDRPGLLHNTRTTVSNPVVRYVYWNNNFHTAHHLVPTVPPHHLPAVDGVIAAANTLRARGFVTFHARILRDLRRSRSAG